MKLTMDNLMKICLKVLLPICLMIKIATLNIDTSAVLILVFLMCNHIRYKVTEEYNNFDMFLIGVMTVSCMTQAMTILIGKIFIG